MTVAAHQKQIPIRHDILTVSGDRVLEINPQPYLRLSACAGVYVLSPAARATIPHGVPFHMTDLIALLLRQNEPVRALRFCDDWHDIGTATDLAEARRSFAEQPFAYLPDSAT